MHVAPDVVHVVLAQPQTFGVTGLGCLRDSPEASGGEMVQVARSDKPAARAYLPAAATAHRLVLVVGQDAIANDKQPLAEGRARVKVRAPAPLLSPPGPVRVLPPHQQVNREVWHGIVRPGVLWRSQGTRQGQANLVEMRGAGP